jgi:hypothetical protein
MNGGRILLNANPIIYMFEGNALALSKIKSKEFWASFKTELKLLGKQNISSEEKQILNSFLDDCIVIDILTRIKSIVKEITRKYYLKLPYAIIAATAIYLDIPLLASDKGFEKIDELSVLLLKI